MQNVVLHFDTDVSEENRAYCPQLLWEHTRLEAQLPACTPLSVTASLLSVGMPVGCLLMSPLLDGLGRRRTLMVVNAPAILGWLLIAMASHNKPWFFYQVYAGRLLTGLAIGLVSAPAVVYVGEVLHKTWRAVVVTWPSLGKLGSVRVHCIRNMHLAS